MDTATPKNKPGLLVVDDLQLDYQSRQVTRRNSPIKGLTDKSFQLVWLLANAAPNPLGRDELMMGVWGNVAVGYDALTQRVKIARNALGKRADGRDYIQVVHGIGYRLLGKSTPGVSNQGLKQPHKYLVNLTVGVFLIFLTYLILSEAGILHLIHKWIN